ncbi:MAG: acyl-CoA synthetase, partial [Pseudomonadota bacterium]
VDVCDRWAAADPNRLALIDVDDSGEAHRVTFGELSAYSNRVANVLMDTGLLAGDRVGILLPQRLETAASHIAAYKLGAIAVPLFTLFGPDALAYRLADASVKTVITDAAGAAKLARIRDKLPAMTIMLTVDGAHQGGIDFHRAVEGAPDRFRAVDSKAEDPALIIYTSGTTGNPKGALHAHRVLLGHLPGVEMSHDLFPHEGDVMWTPADWAWIGGLLDVLLPALHHGIPVVARRFKKFSGEAAFELMADFGVRNTFLPPTALKVMRTIENPKGRWDFNLRTVASGGESLGASLIEWGRETFGVTINEFYGQTECNMIVSSCGHLMDARPGLMGRPVPGHRLTVIDEDGNPLPPGEQGLIAVHRPDPVMFLGYWNNEVATDQKFIGNWLVTGDTGMADKQGWLRFVGRDDDVITSSGYRIGPGEIEDGLMTHPAVKMAGVVGKPDEQRTQIIKAFVVLSDGMTASEELAFDIAHHVKTRLAAHEYPREIEFVDRLPLTPTGKIIRRLLRAGET